MSIARGFQFAGAQNLLLSLWKVNDFTTSVWMEKFYKNIKSSSSYFESNHQAKLDFLNDSSIPNTKKSPYYWSAFVYYGTLENKSSPSNYLLWISIFGGIIILILIFKFMVSIFTNNPTNIVTAAFSICGTIKLAKKFRKKANCVWLLTSLTLKKPVMVWKKAVYPAYCRHYLKGMHLGKIALGECTLGKCRG